MLITKPIELRVTPVTECEDCLGMVVALVIPTIGLGAKFNLIFCSTCMKMLNAQNKVTVNWVEPDKLYRLTGCRVMPHPNRYNVKMFPSMSKWREQRWRRV